MSAVFLLEGLRGRGVEGRRAASKQAGRASGTTPASLPGGAANPGAAVRSQIPSRRLFFAGWEGVYWFCGVVFLL